MYVVDHSGTNTVNAFLIHGALALKAANHKSAISIWYTGRAVCNFMVESFARGSIFDRLEEII